MQGIMNKYLMPRSKTSYEASNGSRKMSTKGVVSYLLQLVREVPINHPSMYNLTSLEKEGSAGLSKFIEHDNDLECSPAVQIL